MKIQNAELLVSAPSKEFWPETTYPEIVLAGRSNVGKSSLINTICNRKSLAYVGNTPGKTRLLNFFKLDEALVLVDVPGYGFANASKSMLVQFGKMMEDYFAHRDQMKGLVLLVDSRHKPTEDDLTMIEFARYYDMKTIIVATKADKVTRSQQKKQCEMIAATLQCPLDSIILFSTVELTGKDQLLDAIEEMLK